MNEVQLFENAVVLATNNSSLHYCQSKCPDQYVGTLKQIINSEDTSAFPCRIEIGSAPALECRVLLIMESPHIDEFKEPPGPAKGKTGSFIRKHINEILSTRVSVHAGLFLVNAVQYQCSLGVPTNQYRDSVFRKAWQSFACDNFSKRLQKLAIDESTYVVNACTKGKKVVGVPSLQMLVEKAIQNSLHRSSDLILSHPVSWWSRLNRKPKSGVS